MRATLLKRTLLVTLLCTSSHMAAAQMAPLSTTGPTPAGNAQGQRLNPDDPRVKLCRQLYHQENVPRAQARPFMVQCLSRPPTNAKINPGANAVNAPAK